MKTTVYISLNRFKTVDTSDKSLVVIDALRASSTIIEAVKNGCRGVLPVSRVEDAIAIKKQREDESIVLGGEQGSKPIQGFDLGNSPKDYTAEAVEGKLVVLLTSNGTQALSSVLGNENVYIASFTNISAVAKKLPRNKDVAILCAGENGALSAEDLFAAGGIIARLEDAGVDVKMDDMSIIATYMYRSLGENMRKELSKTQHYKRLIDLGFEQDINDCLTEDTTTVVPVLKDSLIVKE